MLYKILGKSAFWMVNKSLAKDLGINATILLTELIDKEQIVRTNNSLIDGYFYHLAKDIEVNTTITPHKQRKAVDVLKNAGIIETKLMDVPAKIYYKINQKEVLNRLLDTENTPDVKKFNIKKLKNLTSRCEEISTTINNSISLKKQKKEDNIDLDRFKQVDEIIEWYLSNKRLVKAVVNSNRKHLSNEKKLKDRLHHFGNYLSSIGLYSIPTREFTKHFLAWNEKAPLTVIKEKSINPYDELKKDV